MNVSPPPKTKRRNAAVALATLVLSASSVAVASCGGNSESGTGAESGVSAPGWAVGGGPSVKRSGGQDSAYWRRPASLEKLFADAAFVGAVRVEAVREGIPLETPANPAADGSANDVPPIPTQIVTLTVLKQWGGEKRTTVELFKTGDDKNWEQEDPPYAPGQVYVIAASARPDGLLLTNGPEGRIEVRGGKSKAIAQSPVAEQTNDLDVLALEKKANNARKAKS